MTEHDTKDCDLFAERLNRVLDGDAAQKSLIADEHSTICAACRVRVAAARKLAAWRPMMPELSPGFASNVTSAAIVDRRVRRQRFAYSVSFATLAASVFVGVFLLWPASKPTVLQPQPIVAAPTGVKKPLNEAREAIASLSEKALEESITPAANLFAMPAEKPRVVYTPSRVNLPDAAKGGFEPLVNSPKRAFNLFLRDVGGVAGSRKPNS